MIRLKQKELYDIQSSIIIIITVMFLAGCRKTEDKPLEISMSPDKCELITDQIQEAIDSCGNLGGGTVYFPEGKYLTGGLHLRTNVTLKFDKGAILEGSSNLEDYGEWKWTNGLIMGENLKNVAIIGNGIIDGVDLKNPQGEAGFRGPHCIRLSNCDSITIKDITIVRSANWAMNFRHCSYGYVENVKVRGGHDGLHTRWCNNFEVYNCDFRTGDDCFAGNDNKDFYIENCNINTSCNAFRFGCLNLTIKNCSIWGPGEYKHIKQNRNNTLSAFVHFSPEDEDPKQISGNWLIKDMRVDNVDNFYIYNHEDGLWQTGQPATNIRFENVKVTNVKKSFSIIGDEDRLLNMTIKNSSFSEREGEYFGKMRFEGRNMETPAFFSAIRFGTIELDGVSFTTSFESPVLMAKNGQLLRMEDVDYVPEENNQPFLIDGIEKIEKNSIN